MTKPSTVDEYHAQFTADAAALLDELRRLSRSCSGAASEMLKWNQPAWVHPCGTILFVYSGHKHHANMVFTPSTRAAFADRLEGFGTGKGSVQLPYGQTLPAELLGEMIACRIRELEEDGVNWM